MVNLFDSSLNFLNILKKNESKKESFDVSSNFIDRSASFFTPYKSVLTLLFILLIIIYILISSQMIGFSKMNVYFHLIYSLVLLFIFLLLVT